MKEIIQLLTKRLNYLNELKEKVSHDLTTLPSGKILVSRSNDTYQYYKLEGNQKKYITKQNIDYIIGIAQYQYAKELMSKLLNYEKFLNKTINYLSHNNLENVYTNYSDGKKQLLTPYILPKDTFILRWKKAQASIIENQQSNFPNYSVPEILTDAGEFVRSKSEKIIADKLFSIGIPYAYEVPLYLKNFGYIRPDFKILNAETKKEYIWEHFGLLDDKDYLNKALKKINDYNKNGYYVGENLIITYETKDMPLDTSLIQRMINKYLV